jgi:hypothetical protein
VLTVGIVRLPRVSRAVVLSLSGLVLAALAVVSSSPADAYSDRVRRACSGDYHRLCPAYKLFTPQLRACMESNAFLISSPCVTALIDSGEVDGSKVKKRR